jgi:predicted Zn-dependent protease with MMP-like domain
VHAFVFLFFYQWHWQSFFFGVNLYYRINCYLFAGIYCKPQNLGETKMSQQIVMNFSVPPSMDDMSVIANEQLENMPDELFEFCDDLTIKIEEIPDEATESDLELDDPYELVALYKAGKELSPGVETKAANDDDFLILYRRPLLDAWVESGEDLAQIIRDAMIEEIANNFNFSDNDIEEMSTRHYQGML